MVLMLSQLTDDQLCRKACLITIRLLGDYSPQDTIAYRAIVEEGRRRNLPPGMVEPEWYVKPD